MTSTHRCLCFVPLPTDHPFPSFLPFSLSFPKADVLLGEVSEHRGVCGAGALNPTPSPPLTPCTLLQLPFFLCPGQEMDIIHSKEKNQLGKALWTSPTPTWWDGTAMASEMAGKLLLTWMASSPQRGFCTKNPKAYKVIKNCASKVFFFCLFFCCCFAFKGSL